jgi:hypothetical protein
VVARKLMKIEERIARASVRASRISISEDDSERAEPSSADLSE